jgi:hypothetical protein
MPANMDLSREEQYMTVWLGLSNTFTSVKEPREKWLFSIRKAFDRIEHQAQHKGFGVKWINWIRDILGIGTSVVLLNDVSGKVFHCRGGVRQGILSLHCSLFWQPTYYSLWSIKLKMRGL